THSYTVTDANGCTSVTTIVVTEPTVLVANSSATSILCNGGSATVTVAANGGTAPYNGTGTFTVSAGTHAYTVTDANGCTSVTTIVVAQPTVLVASSSATSVLCNNGSATVTVTANGGTAPYNGTGTFTVSAGTHTYTVTDANGCTSVTTITVGQPSTLTASIANLPVSPINTCGYGPGNANIVIGYGNGPTTAVLNGSATGGTPAYTYSWYPASHLSNSSVANPTFTAPVISGCSNYSYTLTVADANGCMSTQTVAVKVVNVVAAYNNNGSVKKIRVCHITNSANNTEVDIEISPNAVATHLAHGDCLGGCSDDCDPNARIGVVAHDDDYQGGNLVVYPNPNNGSFAVDIVPAIPNTTISLMIYDIAGKLIYSRDYVDAAFVHDDLDLNAITGGAASGMYLIKVVNEEYMFIQRVSVTQ
ncbi:MAG: T9SS type A sorting domain-containing protein, partial [Bacteroidia bacterium]